VARPRARPLRPRVRARAEGRPRRAVADRTPRRVAVERAPRLVRLGQAHRLRAGEDPRRDGDDARRSRQRDGRLHGAGPPSSAKSCA
jgi:hypothetical protein